MPDQASTVWERHVDTARMHILIERGWLSPPVINGRADIRHIDLARALLIADLTDVMGVNDEGVDVVLDLLDKLYRLRRAFDNLVNALDDQPQLVRQQVVHDARRFARGEGGAHPLR